MQVNIKSIIKKGVAEQLLPLDKWCPFPPARDRKAWKKLLEKPLNRKRMHSVVEIASKNLEGILPPIPSATSILAYERTGDRAVYEDPYYTRRGILSTLALAECFEYKGRFIDGTVNALWNICEESSWSLSAHEQVRPLPDVRKPVVDLSSTGTTLLLGEIYYLLGKELDKVAKGIGERIKYEVKRRVLNPYLERDDWWWLRGEIDHPVNNWNAVCNAGVVGAAMYLEDDMVKLSKIVKRSLESIEYFLDCYGPDGGCDEGPGYWSYGVLHLVQLLEFYLSRSEGKIDLYPDERVQAMAEFPHRVHLTGPYYVNFADCAAKVSFNRPLTFRYAERVNSSGLYALASCQPLWEEGCLPIAPAIRELFWPTDQIAPQKISEESEVWFSDLQWMIGRFKADDPDTLILAVKAGHNDEKHNHNDGGNFIIYLDGEPMIIDMGVERYTRQTFSDQRYQLLPIRSKGHNVPLVNEVEQAIDRATSSVEHKSDTNHSSLRQDLGPLYPPEAGIDSWIRTVTLHRTSPRGYIELIDKYSLKSKKANFSLPLYSAQKAVSDSSGTITLKGRNNSLNIKIEGNGLHTKIERVVLKDQNLISLWGKCLWRVRVNIKNQPPRGKLRMCFIPGK